ncbi:MAG: hypothetical protein M3516_10240, partial [Actinomycetota bacterium]|nr:hypothetical protein [Actinomycetota bacterium]
MAKPRRTEEAAAVAQVRGVARVDRRTKNLVARLQAGDIAIIDHADLDRIAAEGLIQRQVAAVVNASSSSTGRYPNLGPLLLCSAGIPVLDAAGPRVMAVPDGSRVVLDEDVLLRVGG